MTVSVLFGCIICVGVVQAAYFLAFFRRTFSLPHDEEAINHRAAVPQWATAAFSVIICARNEASNLKAFLPRVLTQNYHFEDGKPAFEVIVINDTSNDETSDVLKRLSELHRHLRIVSIEAGTERKLPGKKFPLSKGLSAARNEWIACTDADCAPATDVWLHCLAAPLLAGREIVAGYGGYILQKGTVNAFTRYETMHTLLLYYSFAKAGLPYMAVGRNLAATKAAFLRAQAHPLWQATPSGDDDLLIRICGNERNVAVITHPASFTWTSSKATWSEYFAQKQRHVSTGKLYSGRVKALLGGYAFSVASCFLLACLGLVVYWPVWIIALLPLFFVTLALTEVAPHLRQRTNMVKWLAFLFCWTLYNAVLAPYILWKTKQRWK